MLEKEDRGVWGGGCGVFFFFNDTATTEIYTLSLHDALLISRIRERVLQIYAAHPEAASKATRQLFPLMADQDQGERGPVWLAAGEAIAAIGPSVIPELIRRLEPANDITVYRSACAADRKSVG